MAKMLEVDVGEICVGAMDKRSEMEPEALGDLAQSIRRLGLLQPLTVVVGPDGYGLVAGHRRLAACKEVGLDRVPCLVLVGDEARQQETSFAENLFREDFTAVELAAAVKDTVESGAMSVAALGRALRRSEHWIAEQIALCSWPSDVLAALQARQLSVSAASNLAVVTDEPYRNFLVRTAVENGATARTTAAWLQAWRAMMPQEDAIEQGPVGAEHPPTPLCPQAPCLCCSAVFRTDQLSHVPLCASCITTIRNV